MSALGYMTTKEAIVGWRCWRVLPYHELDGSWTYRLCAVGTLGVPKVWTPRRAIEAVCSDYTSEHAAPWPDCECGIWGIERAESARRRMIIFMQTQSEPAAWAWGQVSLWGRVIEHETGWRGQYAYPFAITVESGDEDVARVLRSEYAIDVEWAGGELYAKALAKRQAVAERKKAERESVRRQLSETAERLRELSGSCRRWSEDSMWRKLTYVEDDDVVRALEKARSATVRAFTSLEVSEQLAHDLGPFDYDAEGYRPENFTAEIARKLSVLADGHRVTKWRRGSTGPTRWALPGEVSIGLDGWTEVADPKAAFDDEVLVHLRATLRANKSASARTRDIVAYLGRPDASTSEKVSISHALSRLALRGLVRADGGPINGVRVKSWSLAEADDAE